MHNNIIDIIRYYKSNRDVARDFELQKFINELSVNGDVPPLDGSGGVSI